MKNKIISLLLKVLILSLFSTHSHSSEQNWKPAQEGNKVILIRHSLAPGGGDPTGFKIDDCKTQRNLNQTGIDQSKKIGNLFKIENIPIDQILSSQWCRCIDTAKYAFDELEAWSALNSTFSGTFKKNHSKQISQLKQFLNDWEDDRGNLILVTHYIIIAGALNYYATSGEIVIANKNLEVLGNIKTKF